ncbi:MAG: HEAT repeat domain-containing protein, partial [Elusimicrobia bacterium]|nr:HEAT repeat domain-containing protein [Elusimicrobiota bacterium]
AKQYFPSNPEIRILDESIQNAFVIQIPKKKPVSEKTQPVSASASPAPVAVSSEKFPPSNPSSQKSSNGILLGVGGLGLLSLILILIYGFRRTNRMFAENMKSVQEALQKEEEENRVLLKTAMAQKNAVKQEVVPAKIEPPKASPPPKKQENMVPIPAELKEYLVSKGRIPNPVSPLPVTPKIAEKKQDILFGVSSPEREEAWGRIASQAVQLHEASPQEAIKFVETLASDPDPYKRACIVPALEKIGTPKAWDILLGLVQDPHVDVKREALKCLENFKRRSQENKLTESYRQIIEQALKQEREKGEWLL